MKNANAFTQSDLERLGKVLSDKHGITLRIGGNKCSTDGNTITLPSLPPITEQRILSVVRCFLDHEVGHIIGKTDFLYASNFKQMHGEAAFQLLNSLEDVRCETLAAELRMGCGVNLDLGAKTIQDELDKAAASGDQSVMHPVKQACVAITYGGMGRPLPKYIDPKILDAIKPFEAKIASIGGWAKSTSDVADMIPGLMSAIKQSMAPEPPPPPFGGEGEEQSTEPQPKQENDDEKEKSESDSEESGEGEDAEGDANEDGEGSGDEDTESDADDASGNGDSEDGDDADTDGEGDDEAGSQDSEDDEEESDSNGESDKDDGSGESDSDSGSSGVQPEEHDDSESSDGDGEESESDTQEQEPSSGTGGGAGTQAADIANIDLNTNLAPYAGTGEELAKEIEGEANTIDESDPIQSMRVYDARLDQIHDIPADTIEKAMVGLRDSAAYYKKLAKGRNGSCYPDRGITWNDEAELDAAARTAAGPMRQRLLQILMSEAKVAWRGNLRRGSPDPRNLAALVMGTKDRVMRREKVDDAPDTACMMLLDLSGSMGRHNPMNPQAIDSAVLAAMSFASVLDSAGHACMVCGFQDVYDQSRMAPGYVCNSHDIDDPWFTHNPQVRGRGINLWVAKKWTQKYASARKSLASMLYASAGGTPLAEGMAMAGRELVKRSESRKVMMVFTDGAAGFYYGQGLINKMGCSIYDATIKVVRNTDKQLTAAGVEVVYVGIGDDTVAQYSKKYTVVRDIKQLAKETMLELTKALHH